MAIDLSDINKIMDKIMFRVLIDYTIEDDLYLLQEIIDKVNERKRNKS